MHILVYWEADTSTGYFLYSFDIEIAKIIQLRTARDKKDKKSDILVDIYYLNNP